MSEEDLLELINKRCTMIDIAITDSVKKSIVMLSDGFAYFTHLICTGACTAALPRLIFRSVLFGVLGRRPTTLEITDQDLPNGIKYALDQNRENLGWQYNTAAANRDNTDNRLYVRIIRACSKYKSPWFTEQQIIESIKQSNQRISTKVITDCLTTLCTRDRGPVLIRGEGNRYRFANPLFGGYIKLREYAERNKIALKGV